MIMAHARPAGFLLLAGAHRPWRLFLPLLALVLFSLPAQDALSQYRWPTLQFEVFAGNPFVGSELYEVFGGYEWFESEDFLFSLDDDVAREIERAFHEAAVWYQEHGFPPPELEPIVETDDGPAYRVYVCSYEWDQWAWDRIVNFANQFTEGDLHRFELGQIETEWSRCGANPANTDQNAGAYRRDCPQNAGGRTRIIYINKDSAIGDDGRLTELGYQTLAHELVHAMVPNTALGQSDPDCKLNQWISEGLADAIGWDVAEELWRHRYSPSQHDSDITKRWGYRPYVERLPNSGSVPIPGMPANVTLKAGYATSSFWRFIADAHPRKWNVLVAAGRDGPPGLLDLPLEGTGWRSEVNWIDKGLRGKFNYGLNAMYAAFVGHFSYSVPPFGRYREKPPESQEVMDHWTKLLFEPCASVDLSTASQQSVRLQIKGLAARCIWVEPTGVAGALQVTFQAGSDDLSLLDDIWISRPGTTLQVRASQTGQLPDGPTRYIASWKDFPQDGNERTLYVISNLASQPDRSKPREITLAVSRPSNTNNARGSLPARRAAAVPRKPEFKKRAETLSKQRSATQKMINQQMNLDKETLTADVSSATVISRHTNNGNCPEPFKYDVCGPYLSITLSLMPGTYIIPGSATAQGGAAAQVFGGLQAMSQTSMFDTTERVQELTARLDSIDAHHVNIAIPLIDYGETGSFSNARIDVGMSGERQWSAIGPMDQHYRSPLTGRVTIEEYTPYVIRGSFVAPLAEFLPGAGPNDPPIFTPRQTISGTFTSVAPWLADERVTMINDTREEITDDVVNTLGISPEMVYRLKQDGTIPGGDDAPVPGAGSSSGGGLLSNECTCECDTMETADELCELLCEQEFAACENP